MGVFIGRFVGPVRALIPMVAGMLGMRPLQFTIANVTSAIGWAPAYMLPGILLGAMSFELPPDIAMHVMLVLLLGTLFILLCLWFLYKIFKLINNRVEQFLDWIWHSLKKSSYFSPLTILLKDQNPHKSHGQLALAFCIILTSLLFFFLALYVTIAGPATILVNDALYHLFRGIRSATLDNVMINITLLGQKQIIFPVILVLFGWLIFSQRWRAAFHALALGIMASGSVFVIKHLVQSPRPWGVFAAPENFSMPSGHATLATTVYLGLAFIMADSVPRKWRWAVYMPATLMVFMVGVSRIYLSVHWFTDILGAWLLSTALLMLIILSYHRQKEKPISLPGITLICFSTLCVAFGLYYYQHVTQLKIYYAQINYPTVEISSTQWWEKDHEIPALRVSLFGFPSQPINIEWLGNLEKIEKTLRQEGWTPPPQRDWISALHRVAAIRSTEYLPLVSPQYLDKEPSLILTRSIESRGKKKLYVIRLWKANRITQTLHTPLWVGTVGLVPQSYNWLLRKHSSEIKVDTQLLFPLQSPTEWSTKLIRLKQPDRQKTISVNTLLIKSNHIKE
jgi:membrane-associated phospholipid phosphatase